MLVAITTEGKLGLGTLAGLLIVFAILCAFYFPRRNPDFPGERLGLFVLVTIVLFVATMVGVFVFAAEEEEEGAHAAQTTETQTTETTPTETTPTTTEPGGGGTPQGDAAAGESIFASAGCGSCHILEAAGSSGTVGPNLDEAKPDAALVVDRVTNGMGAMPSFSDQLDEAEIQDVAAYVVESTR